MAAWAIWAGKAGRTNNNIMKFELRDDAYLKKEAEKGKLVKINIKRINEITHESSYSGVYDTINYVDRLNRVWLEEELLTYEEAIIIVDS